ncbi:MAG TPA: hypothetical protein VFN37_04290 [Candidatus Baltobacteraceae bacterium]|nr:hypothetical protein [Candidatus Baltobacteraceae bacterium]
MVSRRSVRRRIDDALAVVSPLALAEAVDAHICSRSTEDLRGLVGRSAKRMDGGDRRQLELYLNLDDADDLLGHRFSAFLRQNPRAIAALDPDAVRAILAELGEIPPVEHFTRRLPARTTAFVALVLAVSLLPLAAQYAHQRGLLQGLTDPLAAPAVITPFVERVSARTVTPKVKKYAHPRHVPRVAVHAAKRPKRRLIAQRDRPRAVHVHHPARAVAWKFAPVNNPYFNRARWHHPYFSDNSLFGERARVSVRSYLHAIAAGNLAAALAHLGMPAGADTSAIAELPIVTRSTRIAIVGSKPAGEREEVQADITTGGQEYYEVFYVARDGPATRIAERYYIPVNRRAQVAVRSFVQNSH